MGPSRSSNSQRRPDRGSLRATTVLVLVAAVAGSFCLQAQANDKKLEIITDKAAVHLDPDRRSPVVDTLDRGSVLNLASSSKFRHNWYYVRFESSPAGRVRSGYVREELVRPLYPSLRVLHIGAEDEILKPKALAPSADAMPALEWGATRERIIQVEGRPMGQERSQGLEILRYRREIMNRRCLVEYAVGRNGLVAVRLLLWEKYSDKSQYIADYYQLRAYLNEQVGRPRSDQVIWQNRYYEKENGRWGTALSMGHLAFSSEWVFRDTSVQLRLSGENDQILLDAELHDVKAKNPASS